MGFQNKIWKGWELGAKCAWRKIITENWSRFSLPSVYLMFFKIKLKTIAFNNLC